MKMSTNNKKKLIFLDVDDTFLTPPYDAAVKGSKLLRYKSFPSEIDFQNRSHVDFHNSFPEIFRTKNQVWLLVLASLPFGFFRSYKLFPELNRDQMTKIIKDECVHLVSKNPPLFKKMRVRRLYEIFQVNISSRYHACGPILKKSTPKIDIIREIANENKAELTNCILMDDDLNNLIEPRKAGVRCYLIHTSWNTSKETLQICKDNDINIVPRKLMINIINDFKNEEEKCIESNNICASI